MNETPYSAPLNNAASIKRDLLKMQCNLKQSEIHCCAVHGPSSAGE